MKSLKLLKGSKCLKYTVEQKSYLLHTKTALHKTKVFSAVTILGLGIGSFYTIGASWCFIPYTWSHLRKWFAQHS